MKSMNYGPTARKDAANNWIFTNKILAAYKNDLPGIAGVKRFHDPTAEEEFGVEAGVEFQFTNGPYGGGRKFVIIAVTEDGIIAREK